MRYKFCVYCGACAVNLGSSLLLSSVKINTLHCNRCNLDFHLVGDAE